MLVEFSLLETSSFHCLTPIDWWHDTVRFDLILKACWGLWGWSHGRSEKYPKNSWYKVRTTYFEKQFPDSKWYNDIKTGQCLCLFLRFGTRSEKSVKTPKSTWNLFYCAANMLVSLLDSLYSVLMWVDINPLSGLWKVWISHRSHVNMWTFTTLSVYVTQTSHTVTSVSGGTFSFFTTFTSNT